MSDWRIRLAQITDADAFHRVEEDAASLLRDEPSLAKTVVPPSSSAAEYRRIIGKGHSLAASVEDDVVGFASALPVRRELHLGEISVAPAHQRRGIGTALIEALAIDAANCGMSAITLNTYRDIAWNGPFYERHGFVELQELETRAHLRRSHEEASMLGMPRDRRCSMIRFLS